VALAVSSAEKPSLAATTSTPTMAATCPPADPHSSPPGRASTDLRTEASCRSEGRTTQEHERRPSGVRRLGRSPGAHGATTARMTGQRGADRPQASSAPACLARWLNWLWRSFRCHLPPLGRNAPSPLNDEGRGGPPAHTGGRALA
jgi:hypothetical protein